MLPVIRRVGAATVAIVAVLATSPTTFAQTSTAAASAAEAYALDIDVELGLTGTPVDLGPESHVTQEFPPQAAAVAQDSLLGTGQIPTGSGALVENIAILEAEAGANGQPAAYGEARATQVKLLNQGGTPLITAEAVTVTSVTDCLTDPKATSEVVNLVVAGSDIDFPSVIDEPNYDLAPQIFEPLGLKVILNEQHPTADGRGYVVNGIHIFNTDTDLPVTLLTGDIIVSHAMSTVNCPNGAPTTGGNNPIFITKDADKASARPGDTITYTATVQNKHASDPCEVNQFIDHLPVAFTYESTSGAFGTVAETETRPGGGTDVVIKPSNVTIPPGGSATQVFVVKVKDDAIPATYFNNVEILCGTQGNWVKGLDAPVTVTTDDPPPPTPKAQCEDGKDNDGDGKIDYPADPGCTSRKDDSEIDEHPRTGGSATVALIGGLLLLTAYGVRRRLPA